jgi:hypothetical protein
MKWKGIDRAQELLKFLGGPGVIHAMTVARASVVGPGVSGRTGACAYTLPLMSFPDWGDVPTWVAAGAASVAFVGAVLAYRAQAAALKTQRDQFADQQEANSKQAEVLDLQAQELRASLKRLEDEAAEKRSEQARQVFIKVDRTARRESMSSTAWLMRALVRNASHAPIYDLHVSWHKGTAPLDQADSLGTLMPGDEIASQRVVDIPDN